MEAKPLDNKRYTNIRSLTIHLSVISKITEIVQKKASGQSLELNKNSRRKGITLLFHFVNFDTPHLGQFERIDIHLKYIIILHIIHLTFVHGNKVKIKLSDDS